MDSNIGRKTKLKISIPLLPIVAYMQQQQNRAACQFFSNLIADCSKLAS